MNAGKMAYVHKPLNETCEPVLTGAETSWQARVTTLRQGKFLSIMQQLLEQTHGEERELAVKCLQTRQKPVAQIEPISATSEKCKILKA